MAYLEVYQKLTRARFALHSMALQKSGKNSYAGYDYFELGDFLVPAMQCLADEGLCPVISFDKEMATMTITDMENGGEIKITSPMAEANLKGCHAIQNVGAVETYQRRYLWVTAMEIVEHDMLEPTVGKESKKEEQFRDGKDKAEQPKITPTNEEIKSTVKTLMEKHKDEVKKYLPDGLKVSQVQTRLIELVKYAQSKLNDGEDIVTRCLDMMRSTKQV